MKAINQASGIECQARFYSVDGTQVTPSTAHWYLTDEESGEVHQDWLATEIVAGDDPYVTVEVPGSLNTVPSNRNYATKRLTIAADRGLAREYSRTVLYRVNRVR